MKIKSAYKKYEIFSWRQEQKDVRRSVIGIIILPVTLWIIFYCVPLLVLSLKFNPLTRNIFWNLLPNLISASIGGFFIWIAVQAFGRGFRRYILPSYLHQKIQEWKGEIKKQKKELKRRTALKLIMDLKLLNEPYIPEEQLVKTIGEQFKEYNKNSPEIIQLVQTVFEQIKENRKNLTETMQQLRVSLDKQKRELACFEYIMSKRNFVQRFVAILFYSYDYWKDEYKDPEIIPLDGDD